MLCIALALLERECRGLGQFFLRDCQITTEKAIPRRHVHSGQMKIKISIIVQLSPTYPRNPLTAVTYRFRIDLPNEDVGPVEALEDFLSQLSADLCNGRREH